MIRQKLVVIAGCLIYFYSTTSLSHDYIECSGPPHFAPIDSTAICVNLLQKQLAAKLKKGGKCQKQEIDLLGLYINRLVIMYERNQDEKTAAEQKKLYRKSNKWYTKIKFKCYKQL